MLELIVEETSRRSSAVWRTGRVAVRVTTTNICCDVIPRSAATRNLLFAWGVAGVWEKQVPRRSAALHSLIA